MYDQMDTVLGRSLIGATGLSSGFLEEIVSRISRDDYPSRWDALGAARDAIRDFEPLLAEHLSDAVLAGWIEGYDDVAKQFTPWLQQEFADTIRRLPPSEPPASSFFGMFDREPNLRLVNTDNAVKRLMERGILTRPQFDAAKEDAARQAFTIAGDLGSDTIERMRFFLSQEIANGTSLAGFKKRVEESLETSPIAPGHLENVYRTNLQSAYRDGRETLRANPIVAATFPYQAYYATHDGRTRHHHRDLEKLGLNGTNIYRVDDPMWDSFTPPWDYNCRCSTRLMTLEQAAAAGVREAREWLETGRPPLQPEYRYAHIPFAPTPGFGHRGNVGVIVMSSVRAPSGYSHDDPLTINGKDYVGGMFIPSDEMKHATKSQKKEIKTGKKDPQQSFSFDEPTKDLPKAEPPARMVAKIAASHSAKLPNGYGAKIGFDSKASSRGWWYRLTGPDGRQDFPTRFKTAGDAARQAATLLHGRNREPAKPTVKAKPSESTPTKTRAPRRETKTNQGNYRYESTEFFSHGLKSKFKDNMAALRTLKTLHVEERSATPEEQATLSKYVGWGQFPALFNYRIGQRYNQDYSKWSDERDDLRSLIGEDAFQSAARSTINSHYTDPGVIQAHWKMAERLGFKGGRMLEPAVGGGYYLGFMPEGIAAKTNVTAVEMDTASGEISKALYPSANVHVSPFQDHPTPDNFYDLVATNVPFSGDVRISDPKYRSMKPTLHDYYFLRSVDTAKPGGLIMHLTSAGTMDKLDDRVRSHIEKNCELVSAVRFPGSQHKELAGTEVVTDMLILRKKNPSIPNVTDETPRDADPKEPGFTGTTVDSLGRLYHWVDGVRVAAPRWDDTVEVPDPAGGSPIAVNRYFAEHPEQILGTLDRTGTMYQGNSKNVSDSGNFDEQLQAAIDRLPQDIVRTGKQTEAEPEDKRISVDSSDKFTEGQLILRDGKTFRHQQGALIEEKSDPRTTGQIKIRDAARALLAAQSAGEGTDDARDALNAAYDEFEKEFGPLSNAANRKALKANPEGPFLLSLEHWNSTSKVATKADIFTRDTLRPDARRDAADTVAEAIGITLHETGGVDVERIAKLTGKSIEDAGEELVSSGMAFEDPATGWLPASEYLSGNTRRKLKEARTAAAADSRYDANVKALERSQPVDIPPEDIGIKLGSPWVPPSVIRDFAAHTLGADPGLIDVRYVKELQDWRVELSSSLAFRSSNVAVWSVKNEDGTAATFEDVLKSALSGKDLIIRSANSDPETGNHPVLVEETKQARLLVDNVKAQFKEWVWDDPQRSQELAELYNQTQNNYVERHFDGSHQTFPGMKQDFKMRDIQRDFVWRVVTTGKGMAAHEVGTGKTASMIASAMELRRLGLAKKPAIACLKANIEQITAEAQDLYPNAKILSTSGMFDAHRRQQTLNAIATGDYDMIILTHDHLEAMKMRPENTAKFIQEEIDELSDAIIEAALAKADASGDKVGNRIVKNLETQKLKLEERLKKSLAEDQKDNVYFEDSGIDMLMVDEAHNFKTLPCNSKNQIKGVPSGGGSNRATDMLAKTQWLMRNNGGRGLVFATGTPVTNTMAELYIMQRFLQPDALKERGIHRFDAWADTYGETSNNFEFKLNGDVQPTVRFSQFMNLPELRHLTSEFMDIQRVDNLKLPNGQPAIARPTKLDKVIVSAPNEAIEGLMKSIHQRADALKNKRPGGKGEDNMLNVCNDSKLGSMDMRLVDEDAEDHPDSKANQAIKNIVRIYHENPGKTQAVFSDLGINPTKATGFSLFADMKRKLIAAGIPASKIVDFSDDKMKDTRREEAQDAMKRGDVQIAFGSTKRLGTGTNIQKNLIAAHHLDIPYVPSALEQRDGRGYRSGNTNKEFSVYKYVQQGSADQLFWQILATKTGFINQYMLGNHVARTMEDINAEQLTPDEMIAVASGNTGLLERVALEQTVKSLKGAEIKHVGDQARITKAIEDAPDKQARLEQMLEKRRQDAAHLTKEAEFRMDIGGRAYLDRKDASPALAEAIAKIQSRNSGTHASMRESIHVGKYRGMGVYVKPDGLLELSGPSGEVYESGASVASLDHAARMIIGKRHLEAETEIENHKADIEAMRKQIGPFRKAKELAEKQAALEEMKAK